MSAEDMLSQEMSSQEVDKPEDDPDFYNEINLELNSMDKELKLMIEKANQLKFRAIRMGPELSHKIGPKENIEEWISVLETMSQTMRQLVPEFGLDSDNEPEEPFISSDESAVTFDDPNQTIDEPKDTTDEPKDTTDEPKDTTDEPKKTYNEPKDSIDELKIISDDQMEATDEPMVTYEDSAVKSPDN